MSAETHFAPNRPHLTSDTTADRFVMSPRRGHLQPAHRGYLYQDIATAYVLVRSVVERYDEVIVDRKQVADDRIDDLEVRAAGRRVRWQFKSSENTTRSLSADDFTASTSSLRIDRLVLTHVGAGDCPADEYRLSATWIPPLGDDPLTTLLEPVVAEPTLAGWASRFFRLRATAIWPEAAAPLWTRLEPGGDDVQFTRDDFLDFCGRFIIELELPIASRELTTPGPLERALLDVLVERVGIGRYPNHGRAPTDVAGLAIRLANLARTEEASLRPDEIERDLDIRVDFGRVAQSFPLDRALFHNRPTFRRQLLEAALAGVHQLVVAAPGVGKSWELTRLIDDLRDAGAIVVRHYCYLEPGDDLVERRVTTDVFFGNLLAELNDADPSLAGAGGARYAAGITEIEATLVKAASAGRPVIVVIDGLDHIARVRAQARGLSEGETDIVERLATVDIPQGVSLVIGSQPGEHLAPLHQRWGEHLTTRELPRWSPDDLASVGDLHGLSSALVSVGLTERDDIDRIRESLALRADGNPLYARYLARGLVAGLKDGSIVAPADWIADAPASEGDVAAYYTHLYRRVNEQAQAVADMLGVIDFSVTARDLQEMMPAFVGAWVPTALNQLTPILTTATGQGGVRIFHESFRRFMTQELVHQGRSPAAALEPVISWLERRGFYDDARAYRFLLPALRRADRGDEVLRRVDVTFVSDSVSHGHRLDSVQRNLALAADVAVERRDWPALTRCVELHRSAYTCFDESQNNWAEYWAAFLALFGAAALRERLLFDGRPTLQYSEGLYACALVDDAGCIAPWREYVALYDTDHDSLDSTANTFDRDGVLDAGEEEAEHVAHGLVRLGERRRVFRWLLRVLRNVGDRFTPLVVRRLAARLARVTSPGLVEQIASRADPARRGGPRLSRRAAAVLRLGIADEFLRVGNLSAATDAASRALADADTPELKAACLDHGAVSRQTRGVPEPATLPIAVGPDEYLHDAVAVRTWVAAVRLYAADVERGQAVLNAEWQRVAGEGWYRCWLHFILALAHVEAERLSGRTGDVREAFAELTRDVHPFRGEPRPCDLYAIRRVIAESVTRGLRLLQSEPDWRDAMRHLTTASEGTASRLDREEGGPLPTGTLLNLLLPHVDMRVGGQLVRAAVDEQIARSNIVGTYYPTHADHAMRLARVLTAVGDIDGAREAWKCAGVFLAAYGWRKDITVFDAIESTPFLRADSQEVALGALADVQSLANAVVAHTDGRSTNHAPNAWLRCLLEVHPAIGTALLARTMTEEHGPGGWVNRQAVEDVAAALKDDADPALLDALLATLRFEIEHEGSAANDADARVAPIIRIADTDRGLAERSMRRVAAEVTGDGRRYNDGAAARIAMIAAELHLPIPRIAEHAAAPPPQQPAPTSDSRMAGCWLPGGRLLPFAAHPSFVDLLYGLRAAGAARQLYERWDDVILPLTYHLGQLVDEGRENDARRLLRFFARDVYVSSGIEHPLGEVAQALDNAGYASLAAVAYTVAFTATRGGGGWLHLGDESHAHLIDRAVTLDAAGSQQVVAAEVAYALRGSWYSAGTSRHLIARLAGWGEATIALEAWRELYAVVRHRLPLAPDDGWFARLRDEAEPEWPDQTWSVDEALVALLLARIGEPRLARKVNALSGLVRAIERRDQAIPRPLRWWLTRNAPVTSIALVFDVLLEAEREPYVITVALEDVLRRYAASDSFAIRRLAGALLERAGYAKDDVERVACVSHAPLESDPPDKHRRRMLHSIDVGEVLDDLSAIWPDLTDDVVRRLHRLAKGEAYEERTRSRFHLSFGRDGDSYPPTPVLHWPEELFFVALSDALCGLSAWLWRSGQWEPGFEDAVLRRVLPNVRLHLALAATRTARPNWPPAEAVESGVGDLPTAGDDDPLFQGWTRLALVEQRYVLDADRPYCRPTEVISVLAGAVATPLGAPSPANAFPFRDGLIEAWWWPEPPEPRFPSRLSAGPLVQLTRSRDLLGSHFVLIPPVEMLAYVRLRMPAFGEPLVWSDERGGAAIVVRTWWMRNAEAMFAEPAGYEGVDLLVRPDLFERLGQLARVPLHELRVVHRARVAEGIKK